MLAHHNSNSNNNQKKKTDKGVGAGEFFYFFIFGSKTKQNKNRRYKRGEKCVFLFFFNLQASLEEKKTKIEDIVYISDFENQYFRKKKER